MKRPTDALNHDASSKERILGAAQAIFAKKGFDGARVDEIAKQAGVNKALIYYYFKSKEEILHALLHLAIDDFSARLGSPADLMSKVLDSPEDADELVVDFLNYLRGRKELLSIAMMELMKDSERRDIIMSHLAEEAWNGDAYASLGIQADPAQARVTEFFTGLMPLAMFLILEDSWSKYYGESSEEITRQFIAAFRETHVRYTMNVLYAKRGGEAGKK